MLRISPDLELPIDAVTQKFAWLGRTGSGKTFACKRFVEQMLLAGAQVLILDSVGVWFGLRQGPHGFDVPVLGGLYGDIPLDPSSGALVAEAAVAHGSSLVLDLSQMSDAGRARFAAAFGARLFELKKANPGAMHLVLDEGQDYVPQDPEKAENMMLHEWVRIAKQGRAFGMGLSIVSQRPQEISKKALNQAECVFAFQLTGPHERKALEYWLADKGLETKLSTTLTTLEVGRPFVWSPQWLKMSAVIQRVLPIVSTDTSQTPKVGDGPRVAVAMKPIDLGALRASMAAVVEELYENDPKALKEEVKRLRAQLGAGSPSGVIVDKKKAEALVRSLGERKKSLQILNHVINGTQKELQSLVGNLRQHVDALVDLAHADTGGMEVEAFLDQLKASPQPRSLPESIQPKPKETSHAKSGRIQRVNAERAANKPNDTGGIPIGEFETLKVISSAKGGANLNLIVLVTGYRKGSIKSYTNRLITRGLVNRENGVFFSTGAGLLVAPPTKLSKGDALVDYYRRTLPAGEGQVLGALRRLHPVHSDIAAVTATCEGLAMGSVKSYLNRLATRGLVERDKGKSWLSKEFGL